jgi:hypothetical protein
MIKKETKLRFESKINKLSHGGCWVWTGNKNEKGYGLVRIDGKRYKAHRIAYELYIGDIPSGMLVCHSCDNPECCNPKHLWLGTHADNQRDKIAKGRDHFSKGYVVSDENRVRISELHKGNTYNLGRVLSDEHKAKLSASHIGKTLSDEHKAKIGASLIGRPVSSETREVLRAKSTGNKNALGNRHSDDAKAARSKMMTGNTRGKGSIRSAESIERYRQAAIKREAVRKANKSLNDINNLN